MFSSAPKEKLGLPLKADWAKWPQSPLRKEEGQIKNKRKKEVRSEWWTVAKVWEQGALSCRAV